MDGEDIANTTRLIEELCSIDQRSETFRYPEDREGHPSVSGEIELERVRGVVDKISLLLECISTAVSVNHGDAF